MRLQPQRYLVVRTACDKKIAKERSAEEDFADDQEVLAKLLSPSREDGEKQGSNDRSGSKSKNTGQESPALAREISGGKRGSAEMNQGGHEDAKQSVKRRPSASTRSGSVANTQARGSGNVANTQALASEIPGAGPGPMKQSQGKRSQGKRSQGKHEDNKRPSKRSANRGGRKSELANSQAPANSQAHASKIAGATLGPIQGELEDDERPLRRPRPQGGLEQLAPAGRPSDLRGAAVERLAMTKAEFRVRCTHMSSETVSGSYGNICSHLDTRLGMMVAVKAFRQRVGAKDRQREAE